MAMSDEEKDRRVEALIDASKRVLDMFRDGYAPTEAQLNRLDGAICGLTTLKVCGHVITEDCYCYDQ